MKKERRVRKNFVANVIDKKFGKMCRYLEYYNSGLENSAISIYY